MKKECQNCPHFTMNLKWIKGLCEVFEGIYLKPDKSACIIGMKRIRDKERKLE